jgi:hypothetical protein
MSSFSTPTPDSVNYRLRLTGHCWRTLTHRDVFTSLNESYLGEHRCIGRRYPHILGRRWLLLVADKGLPSASSPVHALELSLDRSSNWPGLTASGRVVWLRIVPLRNRQLLSPSRDGRTVGVRWRIPVLRDSFTYCGRRYSSGSSTKLG